MGLLGHALTAAASVFRAGHRPITKPATFRGFQVLGYVIVWLAGLLRKFLGGRLDKETYARSVRVLLERMGGLWIKVGQLLSFRIDMFSAELCRELSRLQGQVVGFPPEIARGIGVLHETGVIHRDVKPSNVLFRSTSDGGERLLIADLGLSKALEDASGFTVAAGSPGYMSPEQAVPGGGIDHRVDVYGTGATVYHALTGQVPATGDRPPPSTLRPGLPDGTDAVVLRAMAADPERRWPTARAWRTRCRGWRTGRAPRATTRRSAGHICPTQTPGLDSRGSSCGESPAPRWPSRLRTPAR